MTFSELNRKQQVALVSLVEAIALSDGYVSEGEEGQISKLADALGDDLYRELLEEVNERFPGTDELKTYLETVVDTDARELIYGTALEETMASPTAQHGDIALLDWLRAAWNMNDREIVED